MSATRAEMVLLREALEGVVAPEVATALLFDALEISGRKPPRSLEETRSFAEQALAEAVRRKVRPEDASQILQIIDDLFERAIEGDGVAVDVEVDHEAWEGASDPTATAQMAVVQKPVPVVVLGASDAFAERLTACLGEDRVYAVPVVDEAAFRKAVFAYSPLIVLIDATSPAAVEPRALTAMLRGVPLSAMPVVWGSESGWGRAVLPGLEDAGVPLVTLRREEGIEPLLDLVLARFRGDA
ncbi:hypothetical protein [Sandaracinus amylolyticus]|uniref:hypothetical protein n=1 Tax=Sandaracinus amylolyticus TaxID=927083 RepID=UPI001F306CDE|nr:hypothetical protein [Sandaracinus amylolyticus]UJR80068.1 Hypothetical protein I5071_21120 [Sandaracinus amylolyticus]